MRAFKKPSLSGSAQLDLLKQRGLIIPDDEFALRRLRHIGYYRLSAYMLPFQNGGRGADRHQFKSGTSIDDVVRLYVFDRKLRLLFLDGIERVEISVRAALSGEIAVANGPFWYENQRLFDARFDHAKYLAEIDNYVEKSNDAFITHFYDNYSSPNRPPCWMLFECMPFGTVSKTVRGLIPRNAKELCKDYGVTYDALVSWIHAISYVRNLCAHHSRLWNRTLTIKPLQSHAHRTELTPNNKLYAVAVTILIILSRIAPDTSWPKKLAELLDEFPAVPQRAMGFPDGWRDRPLWSAALA